MIVPISVQYSNEKQPHIRLAIVPRFSEHPSDIASLKAALLDVMKTCLLNEENKNRTSEVSLFYVTSLIEALECDNAQDSGEENDASVSEIQKLYNDTLRISEPKYRLSDLYIISADKETWRDTIVLLKARGFKLLERRRFGKNYYLIFLMNHDYITIDNELLLK